MAKPENRNPNAGLDSWLGKLDEAGFAVQPRVQPKEGGCLRISKHGCAAVLAPSASGEPRFAVRPGLEVSAATAAGVPKTPLSASSGDERERVSPAEPHSEVQPGIEAAHGILHLVDRGFQKFWQDGERRLPALAVQLQALHRFDQDLRAVMGLTALYNEALGTVSARYTYDRLEGRENPKHHRPF